MLTTLLLAGAVILAGCSQTDPQTGAQTGSQTQAQAASAPIFHTNPAQVKAGFPFSEAVELDGLVFLSGQIGTLPDTGALIEGGIEAEARQTMENIGATLEGLDLGFEDVVKCSVMIDDMADWPAFNTVYAEFYDGRFPARSAFGADGLALGAVVEVECIAAR